MTPPDRPSPHDPDARHTVDWYRRGDGGEPARPGAPLLLRCDGGPRLTLLETFPRGSRSSSPVASTCWSTTARCTGGTTNPRRTGSRATALRTGADPTAVRYVVGPPSHPRLRKKYRSTTAAATSRPMAKIRKLDVPVMFRTRKAKFWPKKPVR